MSQKFASLGNLLETYIPKRILRFPDSKFKKILSCFLIIAIFSGILFLVNAIYQITKENPQYSEKKREYHYARPYQQVKALTYTSHINAQKKLVIKCKYFTIKRKKIGGLRFGMMKEAIFYDGVIQLYQYPQQIHNSSAHTADSHENSTRVDDKKPQDIFQTLISKDSPLISGVKNIASVSIKPVTIELFANTELSTKISARSAVFNLKQGTILFSDKVCVLSGQRELLVDTLELNPENKQLTGNNYTLSTADGKTSGKRIVTDLYLRKI
jgi:hypothetical protein